MKLAHCPLVAFRAHNIISSCFKTPKCRPHLSSLRPRLESPTVPHDVLEEQAETKLLRPKYNWYITPFNHQLQSNTHCFIEIYPS